MPSKKKKYNSRFPPARIKKIMQSDEEVGKVAQVITLNRKTSILSSEEFKFLREIANTVPDVNPGTEAEDEEGSVATPTTAGPQTAFQRRTSSAGTSGHQLSAAGQSAAVGFRTRGRPRKRPIVESQSSLRSMTSHEEPEESEETEEDDDEDDGDEEEEVQQSSNSDNNRINSNSQITNNNNHNNSNNYSVINSNYYNSSLQTTNPSPYVSTIQSIASSSVAVLKPNPPKVEEDDDYDN